MEPPAKGAKPDPPSPVADAIGGATVFPARVAARVLRGSLETAVEDLLSAPEVGRILDRALSGPLPEELARSMARHQVVERMIAKLAADGELERLLEAALASPRTLALLDQVLASDATGQVLARVISGPEVRSAVATQSAGFADQVLGGVRHAATRLDRRLVLGKPAGSAAAPFAGLASRGAALVVDALAIVAASVAVGAAAGLVGSLVGGVRPTWLAQLLLSLAAVGVALGYFSLFWSTVGQTPGMRLMHLRVLRQGGVGDLSLWRALARTLGLALAIVPCFLGFVPALFDSRRRALPDYLAGTVVVYDDHDGRTAG
jgi:uncharacterized RDD family membrane protein YckC